MKTRIVLLSIGLILVSGTAGAVGLNAKGAAGVTAVNVTKSHDSSRKDGFKAALDAFIGDKNIKFNSKLFTSKDPETGVLKSQCDVYKFVMPKDKRKKLDNIYEAFEKNRGDSYWSVRQDANSGKHNIYNIAYGDDPDDYYTIGETKAFNVLILNIADKNNSGYRYSYVFEWMEDAGNISGVVLYIYCKIPAQKESTVRTSTYEVPKVTFSANNDTVYIGNDTKIPLNIGKVGTMVGNVLEGMKVSPGTDGDDPEEPSETWLSKFNYLKNMYTGDNSALSSSIVAKISGLCKNGKDLLSKAERELCTEALNEMLDKTQDKFQKGLLRESIRNLK
jgi:hypothetical protein